MLTDLISFDTMLLMSKKPIDNPVTETVFNREIQALHKRMDSVDSSAGRMTHELLKTKEEVQDIKKSMSTKDDINTVLNRIDAFTTRIETFDRKVIVHDDRWAVVTEVPGPEVFPYLFS